MLFCRLAQAGQLFHTALTVPLYFTSAANGTNINGLWGQQQLMGVVVVYFGGPQKAASASALVGYASAVAKSAAPMSELMVHRARFVVGRAHRIKRSWRVLVVALRFIMPMLVRYGDGEARWLHFMKGCGGRSAGLFGGKFVGIFAPRENMLPLGRLLCRPPNTDGHAFPWHGMPPPPDRSIDPSIHPTRSLFLCPPRPPGRYHKLTGKSVTEGAADGVGFLAATATMMAEMSASRHKLRAETTNRAMMVVNQVRTACIG